MLAAFAPSINADAMDLVRSKKGLTQALIGEGYLVKKQWLIILLSVLFVSSLPIIAHAQTPSPTPTPAAGITFIGPGAGLLELLGDKTAARRLAQQAGVPADVQPGLGVADIWFGSMPGDEAFELADQLLEL